MEFPVTWMSWGQRPLTMITSEEKRESTEQNWNSIMTTDSRVVEGEELSPGDRVWIPDLKAEGTVIKQHESLRSVVIQTSNGQVRRNWRMTWRVLAIERRHPVSPQNEPYESHESTPTREEPRRSRGIWNQPRRLRRNAPSWGPNSCKWALTAWTVADPS